MSFYLFIAILCAKMYRVNKALGKVETDRETNEFTERKMKEKEAIEKRYR